MVFESVVEKIIIGGYNKEGVEEPLKITFVYKTGTTLILMEKILSQSVEMLRLYIVTQNCVPMQVTRLPNCVHIVVTTQIAERKNKRGGHRIIGRVAEGVLSRDLTCIGEKFFGTVVVILRELLHIKGSEAPYPPQADSSFLLQVQPVLSVPLQ